MKITGQLGAFLLAIALCGAFVAALCLAFWLDAACDSAQRRIVMKAAGGVGCFEFWLNRYQQLIAAILAVAAAAVTIRQIERQISAQRKQTAIAMLDATRAFVQEYGDLLNDFEPIANIVPMVRAMLARYPSPDVMLGRWGPGGGPFQHIDGLNQFLAARIATRFPEGSAPAIAAKQVENLASALTDRLRVLDQAIVMPPADILNHAVPAQPVMESEKDAATESCNAWAAAVTALKGTLLAEMAARSESYAKLEKLASGEN